MNIDFSKLDYFLQRKAKFLLLKRNGEGGVKITQTLCLASSSVSAAMGLCIVAFIFLAGKHRLGQPAC